MRGARPRAERSEVEGFHRLPQISQITAQRIFQRRAWIARRFGDGAPKRRAIGCPPVARRDGATPRGSRSTDRGDSLPGITQTRKGPVCPPRPGTGESPPESGYAPFRQNPQALRRKIVARRPTARKARSRQRFGDSCSHNTDLRISSTDSRRLRRWEEGAVIREICVNLRNPCSAPRGSHAHGPPSWACLCNRTCHVFERRADMWAKESPPGRGGVTGSRSRTARERPPAPRARPSGAAGSAPGTGWAASRPSGGRRR